MGEQVENDTLYNVHKSAISKSLNIVKNPNPNIFVD